MLANWMLEFLGIALLFGAAALAMEAVLHRWRVQTRFAWAAALAAVLILAVAPLPSRTVEKTGEAGGAREIDSGLAVAAEPEIQTSGTGRSVEIPERAIGLLWLVGSAGVVAYLTLGEYRLRRLRRTWERAELDGVEVWLSTDVGPAVVGILRREIVVPRWIARLDHRRRRFAVQHEMEHIRGADIHVWLFGLLMVAVFPWNAAVLWMVHRLRSAIELDCDQRVLERVDGDVGAYGALLVEMAGRGRALPLAAAAMASRRTQVERRVLAMTRPAGRFRRISTLVGVLVTIVLVVSACELARPVTEVVTPLPGPGDAAVEPAIESADAGRDVQPESPQAAVAPGPDDAADDPAPSPSGDRPAAQGGRVMAIDPTDPAAEPREVGRVRPPVGVDDGVPAAAVDLSAEPRFTPRTIDPTLRNRTEFIAALERRYPAMLKDAGVGGTTVLWVYIDEEGFVRNTRVTSSSGVPQLDAIAEQLMLDVANFTPAQNAQRNVPVWVQLPISFTVR